MDAASELENKKWSRSNKDAVLKWVDDVEKELKRRKFTGRHIDPPRFESRAVAFLDLC